ncbi:MAG: metallophosphoesterase family protein [Kiritimatiellia bacterium]
MKFAILSDVHANAEALKTVLRDVREHGVERIVCLGDVVGYGPDPVESLRLCRESCQVVLMGNHDAAVVGAISCDDFRPEARMGVFRHRRELPAEDRAWLAGRPHVCRTRSFLGVHGSPFRPEDFNYVLDEADAEDAMAAATGRRLVFVGHTHFSTCWERVPGQPPVESGAVDRTLGPRGRLIVNVGSVGYPRVESESVYVLYDSRSRRIAYRRLPFDFKGYVRRMGQKGISLPEWLEERWRERLK